MAKSIFSRRESQYLQDPDDEINELNQDLLDWDVGYDGRIEDYSNYLDSEDWKQKRQKVLSRDNFKCVRCLDSESLNVHHIWYAKNWQKQPISSLITLCRKCHELEHKI